MIVGGSSSDYSALCGRQEVNCVGDDCGYNHDNEEQHTEDDDRLAGTKIDASIALCSFRKIALRAVSGRRGFIYR